MLKAFQREDDIVLQGFGRYHIKTTPEQYCYVAKKFITFVVSIVNRYFLLFNYFYLGNNV